MGYSPTRYSTATATDIDLMFKLERAEQSSKYDDAVWCFQQEYVDLNGPPVKDSKGRLKPLTVDGQRGPQTVNAEAVFQEAAGLPRSGKLDIFTMNDADWRVFGLDGRSWKPCSLTTTNIKPGGPAIVKGHNQYLRPLVRVNSIGLTREGQRLSDVLEAKYRRSLGWEGAVNRNQVGTSSLSRHALGVAGDDMGDQDKDRIIEPDEILMLDQNWDYLYERAQWFPAVRMTMQQEIDGVTQTRDFTFRGRDRLVTMVLGNLKYPSGKLIFPGYVYRRDVSWTAARNTPKQLTAQTHVAPFHHHTDCAPGAPFGSPFV